MSRWIQTQLGSIADIMMGQSPKSEYYNSIGDGLPFLQGNRTFGDKYPHFDTYTTNPTKIAEANDIIMSVRAPVGDLNITPTKICVGRGVCALRMKNGNQEFLYYLMKNNVQNLLNRESGTVFGSVNRGDIGSLDVLVPENDKTQQKIAKILSALDDKIELNNRINNNLEQQAQALFLDFMQKNYCEQKLLSDVSVIKYGKGLPTSKLLKTGYKVFGGNGIIGYYSDFLYKEPQILISCRGAASGTVLESHPFSYITNNSLVVELNDRRYYEFLKRYLFLNQLHSYTTGSAQPQITIDNLKTVEIPYPNFEAIERLTQLLEALSATTYQNICENTRLAQLRDTLLPKLMSGEIDVSNVNISTDKSSFTEKGE